MSNQYCTGTRCKEINSGLDFTGYSDTVLDAMLESASRVIDNFTNQIFYKDTFTDEKKEMRLDRYGNLVLRPKYKPLVTVTKLELKTQPGDAILIDSSRLDIYKEQGIIKVYGASINDYARTSKFDFAEGFYNTILTYEAGYDEVPKPVELATAMIFRNMMRPGDLVNNLGETEKASTGELIKVKSKNYEETYAQESAGSGAISRRVAEEPDLVLTNDVRVLLSPYIKRGVI